MPKRIEFEGKIHEFPDDVSDSDVSMALGGYSQSQAGNQTSVPMGDDNEAVDMTARNPNAIENSKYFSPDIPIPMNQKALQLTGQAMGRGAANVAGGIPVLADMGIDAVGRIIYSPNYDNTLLDPIKSDSIADAFGAIAKQAGYPIQDPNTLEGADKRLYNIVSFGSGGGASGVASKAIGVSKAFGKVGDVIGSNYATGWGRQLVDDVVTGAGAGLGFDVAENAAPNSPISQTIAAIAGGAGASKASRVAENMGKGVVNKVKDTVNPYTLSDGGTIKYGEAENLAKVLQNTAEDPQRASANIRQSVSEGEALGIKSPTIGASSNDKSLASIESGMRTRNQLPFVKADMKTQTGVDSVLDGMTTPNADRTAPQGVAKLEADRQIGKSQSEMISARENKNRLLSDEEILKQDILKQEESKQDILKQEESKQDILKQDIYRPVTSEKYEKATASRAIDEQISLKEKSDVKVKNEMYFTGAKGQRVSIKPIADALDTVKSEMNILKYDNTGIAPQFINRVLKLLPDEVEEATGILDTGGKSITKTINKGGDGEVDLRDVLGLRADLTRAINDAQNKGNTDLSKQLLTLKTSIKDLVKNIPSLAPAEKNYKDKFAVDWVGNFAAKWRDKKNKSTNIADANPEATADHFLGKKKPRDAAEDLARLSETVPDKKALDGAVRQYMAADLAFALGDKPAPRAIAKWVKERSEQLDQFPSIKKEFQTLHKNAEALDNAFNTKSDALNNAFNTKSDALNDKSLKLKTMIKEAGDLLKDREKDVTATERRVNKGTLGILTNQDTDKYVGSLFGGKNPVQKLKEAKALVKGNKQAEEGLKGAVVDHFTNKLTGVNTKLSDGEGGSLNYEKLANALKSNEPAMAQIFSPKEMSDLKRVRDLMSSYDNLKINATKTGTQSTKRDDVLLALEAGLKLKYGGLVGGNKFRVIRLADKRLGGESKADEMLTRIFTDPKVAAELLDMKVGSDARLNKLLLGFTVAPIGERGDDEENKGVNDEDKK